MTEQKDQPGQAMAGRQPSGQLAQATTDNPWTDLGLLKPYKAEAVVSTPRVDALATISAGTKKEGRTGRMIPSASRDGTIFIHDEGGRAPGLAKVLKERGGQSLTIALVSNNPAEILQQRFASYTASRLLAYGDEHTITVLRARTNQRGDEIKNPDGTVVVDRDVVRVGEPEFEAVAATCKAQSSLYFALAKWEDGRPVLWFPDGLGLYRLRFTSLNSAENIKGSLAYVASLTGGRVAGIPLELAIVNREVSAPDGSRRTVPVWTLVLQPPETIQLEAGAVRQILESGLAQAQALSLPAPRPESLDVALTEGDDVDLDEAIIDGQVVRDPTSENIRMLRGGGRCDPDWLRANWFAAVDGSPLDSAEARRRFLSDFTFGRCASLAEFALTASRSEAEDLLKTAHQWIVAEIERRREAGEPRPERAAREPLRSYEQLFPDEDEPRSEPSEPGNPGLTERGHAAAVLTGAPAVLDPWEQDELPADVPPADEIGEGVF